MKLKKLVLLTAAFVCLWITCGPVSAQYRIEPTDVSAARDGCTMLGLHGTYIVQIQAALDLINSYRLEACREGVENPSTGNPLTEADYVPIKWSGDLEYIARIRAAEAALTVDHARTNGTSIWALESPNGIRSLGEVLAWNHSGSMLTGIQQWYREKYDWVNQTQGAVTGHYTSMIDPDNLYVGLGTFYTDSNTTAGEFSPYSGLSETPLNWSGECIQLLEITNENLTNQYKISGTLSGQAGSTADLEVTTGVHFTDFWAGTVNGLIIPGTVLWESSDTRVASVDSNGKVQAKYCGSATITANPVGMSGNAKVTYTVDHKSVTDEAVAATCTKTGLTEGSHCPVCNTVLKAQEVVQMVPHDWDDGEVTKEATALEAGVMTKTCHACGKTETSVINKLKPTYTLSASKVSEEVGASTAITVSGLAKGDSVKSWTSADRTVATVTSGGVIKGIKAGSTVVTITLASGKEIPVKVTVNSATTKSIKGLSKTLTVKKGKTFTLKPVRYPAVSKEAFSYTSSNKKVVTVSAKGVIKAVGKGTAKVTVKSGKATFTVTVKVPLTKTTKITGIKKKLTLKKGKTLKLAPKRTPSNSDQKITFKSSKKSVCSVSSKGKLTAKKKGTAVITVTSGSISVKCKVTVK